MGLLYQQGYFRQVIDKDGAQQALYPVQRSRTAADHAGAPRRTASGCGWRSRCRATRSGCAPGRSRSAECKLYLLDSNDAANVPAHRGITSELYGGGPELRLKQEMLLGIGGWRLLGALGIKPEVCHLNEGHAAFAVLERARSFMEDTGQPFDVALAVDARREPLHHPHGRSPPASIGSRPPSSNSISAGTPRQKLGITLHDLLALGRRNPNDPSEPFNMAYLAIRGSGAVNGVSRLHGRSAGASSRRCFPRWPEDDVPVGHVTNGVHMPTWDSAAADDLWTEACGKDRWLGTDGEPGAGHSPRLRRQAVAVPHRRQHVAGRLRSRAPGPAAGRSPARRPRRSSGRRHLFDPRRVDAGLRAALRDLQAAQPAAARPRPAAAPA